MQKMYKTKVLSLGTWPTEGPGFQLAVDAWRAFTAGLERLTQEDVPAHDDRVTQLVAAARQAANQATVHLTPMTAPEAEASAAAEGLILRRNEESATGFEGVEGKVGARTRIQPAQQSACLHTCGFHLTVRKLPPHCCRRESIELDWPVSMGKCALRVRTPQLRRQHWCVRGQCSIQRLLKILTTMQLVKATRSLRARPPAQRTKFHTVQVKVAQPPHLPRLRRHRRPTPLMASPPGVHTLRVAALDCRRSCNRASQMIPTSQAWQAPPSERGSKYRHKGEAMLIQLRMSSAWIPQPRPMPFVRVSKTMAIAILAAKYARCREGHTTAHPCTHLLT